MINFELSETQKEFQTHARQFSQKELAPFAAEWDEKKFFPLETIKKAGELGFCGLYTPEKFGGMGLSRLDSTIIFEELAHGCTSTAAYITIHNMVTWMIASFAKEEVRQKLCPDMAAGRKLGCYCLTEPGSGSDAGSLKASARKKGNRYILNGTKAFISGAGAGNILVVMARTAESAISAFVVPAQQPGIEYGKNEEKMGWNSQPTRLVNLTNVEIPEANLLGEEGQGFKIAMMGLDGGRVNIGTCSVGTAQAALSRAQNYMQEREQFGQKLAAFQALQFKLATMATALVASRQMIRLAAYKLDTNHPQKTLYCAMAKRFATDECFKICNEALQLHGGYGYTKEYPLERHLRDCRVHQILEGTNEIMQVVISRQLLKANSGDIL